MGQKLLNLPMTPNDCITLYDALENQFGKGALKKFDLKAQANMKQMNNFSTMLYSRFKNEILKK